MTVKEWAEKHADEIKEHEINQDICPVGMSDSEALDILTTYLWNNEKGTRYISMPLGRNQANRIIVEDILKQYAGKRFSKAIKEMEK